MKILITTGLYPPEIGGPATYTKIMEDELPKIGIEVAVLPFSSVRKLPKIIRHGVFFFKVLARMRRADLVFAQDPVSVGLPSMCAAKLVRKKFCIRMPGDYAWEQATQRWGVTDSIDTFQHTQYGLRVELLRSLQKFVTRQADLVITPSRYFRDIVLGWGISEASVRTVYNGIDFNVVPKKPAERPPGNVIVTAGRLVPWKGFDMLIELLPQLPEWHLVIIGEGPYRQELEKLAASNDVTERVTFTGSIQREEVFGWYSVATAFVLNTSFESFSFQVVEALHAGVPVIATNIGSLPELVEHEKEGLLLKPNDTKAFYEAIMSTVVEKETWQVRCEFSKSKSRQFNVFSTIIQLKELLIEFKV